MITKFPHQSTLASEPLWLSDRPTSLKTIHRSDYRGHYHSTKIPGPNCLIAKNKKFKNSAYLSTLPLSPPTNVEKGKAGKTWLADIFQSKEKKWRRGNNLFVSSDAFDVFSNYQMQFTAKPIENRIIHVPKHVPLKTMEKFDSVSTYISDYQTKPCNQDDISPVLQRRQGTDIIAWTNGPGSPQQSTHRRTELPPLESSTSYRTEFPTWSVTARQCLKPFALNDKPVTYLPFDGETCYRADYKTKPPTDDRIISSCGQLNRELRDNHVSLVPYIEYQRPLFYNVKVDE